MSKNPSSRTKQAQANAQMNYAMKFFLAGCLAELYLLILRRFYVNGNIHQVVAWDGYLNYFLYAGVVITAVGLVLSFLWKQAKAKREVAGWILAGGAFLAVSSIFIRFYYSSALTLLCVVVPVVMILGILWNLYDREFAWSLSTLSFSLVATWAAHRGLNHIYAGTIVKISLGLCLLAVALLAFLTSKSQKNGGKLGKFTFLPANADVRPIYLACGLSLVAMAVSFISTSIAYYAMWGLAMVLFALAVYYTVKQL